VGLEACGSPHPLAGRLKRICTTALEIERPKL
jgi:hypothetical protein